MATMATMAAPLRRIGVIGAVLVLVTASAAGAGGGDGPFDWTMDPTSGPAGTVITVTGTCPLPVGENDWDSVGLFLQDPNAEPPESMGEEAVWLDERFEPITAGEEWSFTLTVPADVDPSTLEVGKQCASVDGEGAYDRGETTTWMDFVVTAPTTTSTTTPAPETTEPEAPASETPAPAAAAVAAVATPTFTG